MFKNITMYLMNKTLRYSMYFVIHYILHVYLFFKQINTHL
jgi:hypothetical protein